MTDKVDEDVACATMDAMFEAEQACINVIRRAARTVSDDDAKGVVLSVCTMVSANIIGAIFPPAEWSAAADKFAATIKQVLGE